ncbi:hypothetical protein KIL84_008768 [Mauremys mutica]|uniref:Uncharacterized protein n=1 Tax=Mauremys mutica TaxID=74926 RepID=A0A9D4ASQ5_9SAUR|nr:hypothetical protein KIL84_008768 [Mauremys mutica]
MVYLSYFKKKNPILVAISATRGNCCCRREPSMGGQCRARQIWGRPRSWNRVASAPLATLLPSDASLRILARNRLSTDIPSLSKQKEARWVEDLSFRSSPDSKPTN